MVFERHKWKSPNFNERVGYDAPNMLVLHYTGMKSAKAALQRLCDENAEVSAHYVIEENGKTHQLVEDDKRAWHAGKSYWKGETDINSASIGIEFINPGHEFGYTEFPKKQISTGLALCKMLCGKYNIPPSNVLGHSDIAIKRKIDPGHLFPWVALAREGIGLWPTPQEMDYQAAEDLLLNDGIHELLAGYGYDPSEPLEESIIAFHRHFAPEKFNNWDDRPNEADIATGAKLLSLIRQMHETP